MTIKVKIYFEVISNKTERLNIITEALLIIQNQEALSQWFIWNKHFQFKFNTKTILIPIKKTMEWI